jgi:hypothetical protein
MSNITKLGLAFLVAMLAAETTWSQTEGAKPATPEKYFRLDFVVKEVEGGKTVNARAYSITILSGNSQSSSSLRTGTKVPIPMGGNFQYVDVGVNIDCRSAKELQNQLALIVSADLSTAPSEAPMGPPVVRQNRWSSNVLVPIRKPTVIFSSDDLTSKRQMQLELTATPIM